MFWESSRVREVKPILGERIGYQLMNFPALAPLTSGLTGVFGCGFDAPHWRFPSSPRIPACHLFSQWASSSPRRGLTSRQPYRCYKTQRKDKAKKYNGKMGSQPQNAG
jgi:hypothetical protein